MNHGKCGRLIAILFASGLFASGCAYGPLDGDNIGAARNATFIGFATAPSIQVRLQYLGAGGVWTTFKTLLSDPTPWAGSPPFTTNLYQWGDTFVVTADAFTATAPSNRATIRAQQKSGNTWVVMYMYDADGFDCLQERFIEELLDGDSQALNAQQNGIDCSDDGAGNPRNQIDIFRP